MMKVAGRELDYLKVALVSKHVGLTLTGSADQQFSDH
jgi:hypothetical protein